jgi:hypothetical protein
MTATMTTVTARQVVRGLADVDLLRLVNGYSQHAAAHGDKLIRELLGAEPRRDDETPGDTARAADMIAATVTACMTGDNPGDRENARGLLRDFAAGLIDTAAPIEART